MTLPVGYYPFHKNKFFNYQLNRWYALGYACKKDLEEIGSEIKSFDDYVKAFRSAAEKAKAENRLKHAATYLRAAEFLLPPTDSTKQKTYLEFIELFDRAHEIEPYERHDIPYEGTLLTAMKLPSKTREVKGTLVGIPGFDALIEEFFSIWDFFTQHGYEVIAFEGPGQGGSLRVHGVPFDHDYEKAYKAVLDYFNLTRVTAVGISMGGYWVIRAAALEKRIVRVIAMPPVYDWLELTHPVNRGIARWMLRHRRITNFLVRLKMRVPVLKHAVQHAQFIQDKHQPYDAVRWMMGMNKEHLLSHLVNQDVLLLGGENDAFQPPRLVDKQKRALIHARTIRERIFLKSESADQHCQIGNVSLALQTMLDWLDKFEEK